MRYKNRQDKLIYRSVTYDPNLHPTNNPPMVKDLHTDKEYVILKMTQKFELDPSKPAEE